MRKIVRLTLISGLIIVAVVLAVVTVGCGSSTQNAAQAQPGPTDAQGILNQVLTSTQNISAGSGQFNIGITVNGNASQMPSGAQAFLGQPINISGTYSFNTNPEAVDLSANATIAGQNIAFGLKSVNNQAWVQFMGQWYELPADVAQQGTSTIGTTTPMDINGILQALTAAGVDPTKWLTNPTVTTDTTTISGTPTYHLTGTVDVNQVVTDISKLMQDPNIQKLLPSMMGAAGGMMGTGSTDTTGSTGSTDTSITMPSQQDLQNIQNEITSILKNVTIDLWVTQDTYQVRQASVNATVVPPADQSTQGINSIALNATVSVTPSATPVTVTPPANARPFSELQQALQGLSSLFGGMFGSGSTETTTSTLGQ